MPANILIVSNCDNLLVFALKAFERTTLQRPWAKFLSGLGLNRASSVQQKLLQCSFYFSAQMVSLATKRDKVKMGSVADFGTCL